MTDNAQQFKAGVLCRTKQLLEFWFRSADPEPRLCTQPTYSPEWEKEEDSYWYNDREYNKGSLVLIARPFVVLDEEEDDFGFIEVVMNDGRLARTYAHRCRSGESIDCLLEPVDV